MFGFRKEQSPPSRLVPPNAKAEWTVVGSTATFGPVILNADGSISIQHARLTQATLSRLSPVGVGPEGKGWIALGAGSPRRL